MSKDNSDANPSLAFRSLLKNHFFELLTEYSSSHLSEATAAGLGYRSNAACLADLKTGRSVALPRSSYDTESMASRLSTLSGVKLEQVRQRVRAASAVIQLGENIQVGERSALIMDGLGELREIVREALKQRLKFIHIMENGSKTGFQVTRDRILVYSGDFDHFAAATGTSPDFGTAKLEIEVDGIPVQLETIYTPMSHIVIRLQYEMPHPGYDEKVVQDAIASISAADTGGIMVISGPPLSGKSTSARLVAEHFLAAGPTDRQIVTIDDLRDEALRQKAVDYAKSGAIVIAISYAPDIETTLKRLRNIGFTTETSSLLLGVVNQRLVKGSAGRRVLLNERVFFANADEARTAFDGGEPTWPSIVKDGLMKYVTGLVDISELRHEFGAVVDQVENHAKSPQPRDLQLQDIFGDDTDRVAEQLGMRPATP